MRLWRTSLTACLTLALCAGAAHAQPACHGAATPYRVLVTVQGVRSSAGNVVTNLYGSDKRRFLADNGWISVWQDPARPGDDTVCFFVPAAGQYALVMYHDANGDGVLNQGMFGLPREGYGFSNNVRPFLKAPSLKSASFAVGPGDTRLQIRLHYP